MKRRRSLSKKFRLKVLLEGSGQWRASLLAIVDYGVLQISVFCLDSGG
jgi:hypothetical protein